MPISLAPLIYLRISIQNIGGDFGLSTGASVKCTLGADADADIRSFLLSPPQRKDIISSSFDG